MINKIFPTAAIIIGDGLLTIDATHTSIFNKYYNVTVVENDDKTITVKGEKPKFETTIFENDKLTADMLIEEDTELVKKYWLFGEKIRVPKRNQIVEYKKRDHKTFTSNNYLIIE